jgi:hypothetical protein
MKENLKCTQFVRRTSPRRAAKLDRGAALFEQANTLNLRAAEVLTAAGGPNLERQVAAIYGQKRDATAFWTALEAQIGHAVPRLDYSYSVEHVAMLMGAYSCILRTAGVDVEALLPGGVVC